jgi:hypothetical protein
METEEDMLNKYRQQAEDPEADYEMDHQSHDHQQQQQQQQQQQHLQPMQAQSSNATHESQSHANLQPHPPITSVSNQPEQMSPATRPSVVRTGASFIFSIFYIFILQLHVAENYNMLTMKIIGRRGRPPGSKNKIPARRKSSPAESKLDEQVCLSILVI